MDMSDMAGMSGMSGMDMTGMDMATTSTTAASTSVMSSMIMSSSSSSSSSVSSAISSMTTKVSSITSSMTVSMSSATASVSSSISSMAMSMSGMAMSMSGMDMSGMDMSATTDTSTATATSMAGMDMSNSNSSSSSSMSMSMGMNEYLTPHFNGYPVLFQHLKGHTKRQAFGIFCLILAGAFVYKLCNCVLWYLELIWANKKQEKENKEEMWANARRRNIMIEFFHHSGYSLMQDFIRMILVFISTMFAYMLMLAAMSFVLTYVFAVITGIALFEVMFNRFKVIILRDRRLKLIKKCPGGNGCVCGIHKKNVDATSLYSSTTAEEKISEQIPRAGGCCCADATDEVSDAADAERNIQDAQEMSANRDVTDMGVDLNPRDKVM
ncbi:uncharacterized protein SCODWIG_01439 [Saccharomycodes ludwigii]|uniref:Copper transport protein n=1 Tax=Saccharomycodes ludwigii TaxID=36035 RepID=A0A376B4R0_9ASCO|nr:hypothetical protein SCDLUD_002442 [Saccharomycodes ludwigii]KAH3900979.1 hypothetical protein SCDLUD_002442 [Saccharomycodes ludwigii]SSD59678.1 uncharacterized protein SCODWIG_01439 [Saccharomycodes ludwigii]